MKFLRPISRALACALFFALGLLTVQVQADVITLYEGLADFAGISQVQSDGTTFIVENFDGSATIGDGDGLRLADYSTVDKPEAWWDLATTIAGGPGAGGFRLDISAANLNVDPGDQDINLRFGNNNTNRPTSSARTWTTFSFEQDGSLKIDGSTQADFGNGPLDISFVVNTSSDTGLTYTLNGITRTLAALSSDTWVGGTLEDADNPMNIGSSIVQADGINELGFTGSSDAASGMDFLFDNMILYTGNDISQVIPEPSSAALLLSGLLSLGLIRRRNG